LINIHGKIYFLKYYHFGEADVDNLYPLININDALEATYSLFTPKSLYQLLHQVNTLGTKNNYIMFDVDTHLPFRGTC